MLLVTLAPEKSSDSFLVAGEANILKMRPRPKDCTGKGRGVSVVEERLREWACLQSTLLPDDSTFAATDHVFIMFSSAMIAGTTGFLDA